MSAVLVPLTAFILGILLGYAQREQEKRREEPSQSPTRHRVVQVRGRLELQESGFDGAWFTIDQFRTPAEVAAFIACTESIARDQRAALERFKEGR